MKIVWSILFALSMMTSSIGLSESLSYSEENVQFSSVSAQETEDGRFYVLHNEEYIPLDEAYISGNTFCTKLNMYSAGIFVNPEDWPTALYIDRETMHLVSFWAGDFCQIYPIVGTEYCVPIVFDIPYSHKTKEIDTQSQISVQMFTPQIEEEWSAIKRYLHIEEVNGILPADWEKLHRFIDIGVFSGEKDEEFKFGYFSGTRFSEKNLNANVSTILYDLDQKLINLNMTPTREGYYLVNISDIPSGFYALWGDYLVYIN